MNNDLLVLAMREIGQTRDLVQALLVSSESFDYARARTALNSLEQKVRDLAKLQTKLKRRYNLASRPENVLTVNFKQPLDQTKNIPRQP